MRYEDPSARIASAVAVIAIALSPGLVVFAQTTSASSAQQLFAARERLDQTLWKPEVEAQRHERRFVQLWDDLLRRENKFEILASVPFSTLTIGDPVEHTALDLDIQRTRFGQPERDLSPEDWKRLLAHFHAEGYEIEQTEWHHSSFQAPGDGQPARSDVSAVIYAARERPAHRVMLRATLAVMWSPRVDAQDVPIPESIAVTSLELLERHSPPVFREVFQVERTAPLGPLLVDDLDGDGLSEIVLPGGNLTLWNHGERPFEAKPFLDPHAFTDAGILADLTNDGHVDFVAVETSGYPLLFEGDGERQFTHVGRRIADIRFAQPSSYTAGDIDADGDLDLFVANYKSPYTGGQMPTPYYDANDGFPAYLFRNDGDGTFTDISEASGLSEKRFRRTYTSSFIDIDDDDDMDLLVVNDFAGFDMYLNDGRGRFTDVTDGFGRDRHLFGMAHTFGDYDSDGDLDFYVIGMSSTTARRLEGMGLGPDDKREHNALRTAMGEGNRMFLRTGDGFELAPFNDQVARTGWSWGTSSFDFDNDGDTDIFVANGHVSGESTQDYCTIFWRHDIYTDDSQENAARDNLFQFVMTPLRDTAISWNGYEHKVLWMNEGGGRFTNVAYLLGVAFEYDGRAVVADDLDGDGNVDLLVIEHRWGGGTSDNADRQILHVYQNRLPDTGNWIGVRLGRSGPGQSPVGATVTIATASGSQTTRIVTGDSFAAQHPATAHFGLGALTQVEAIDVRWASGAHRRIEQPDINQYVTVSPPSTIP